MKPKIVCPFCGSKMVLDDTDITFSGWFNEYWTCDLCQTSCIVEYRGGLPRLQRWHSERERVLDWEVQL